MTKDIYKITNRINGKVYIGQSKDPHRRFKDHVYGKNNERNSAIHNAIKKYGVHAFDFDVIEHDVSEYNDREKYWIAYYRSNQHQYGYNITDGGDDPPILCGEESALCKLKDVDILHVVEDLSNGTMSYTEIANKYGITTQTIQHINAGESRRIDGVAYPVRYQPNFRKGRKLVIDVLYDLVNTCDSTEQIANKYGVDSNFVYDVNNGSHHFSPGWFDYPARNPYCRISRSTISKIYSDIAAGKKPFSQIEAEYGISHCTLSRINKGIIYVDETISYPIRKSSQRVYKPVETIPGETGSRNAIDTHFEMALSFMD